MFRYRARTDANHADVCAAFRKAGGFVLDLRSVGGGITDTAVLFRGQTIWCEIKADDAAARRKGATARRQQEFRDRAREHGVHVYVITDPEDAVRLLRGLADA